MVAHGMLPENSVKHTRDEFGQMGEKVDELVYTLKGNADFAQRIGKIASVSQQHAISEELDKAIYYIERNAHAKMLFHALTIKLYHIIQDKALILAG